MSWLVTRPETASAFEDVLALRPDLLEGYRAFYGSLWDDELLPSRLLELCRLRIAALAGCEAEAAITHAGSGVTALEREVLARREIPDSTSDLERRALAIASKVPFEIHGLEDDGLAALREALGDDGLVALMVALPLFDANCRLRLVLEVGPVYNEVSLPASRSGTLY